MSENEDEGQQLVHFKKTSGVRRGGASTRGSNHARTFSTDFEDVSVSISPAPTPTASNASMNAFKPIPEDSKPSIPLPGVPGGPSMPSGPPPLSSQQSTLGSKKIPAGAVATFPTPSLPTPAASGPQLSIPTPPAMPSNGPPSMPSNGPPPTPTHGGPPSFNPQLSINPSLTGPNTPYNAATPSNAAIFSPSSPTNFMTPTYARQPTIAQTGGSIQINQHESAIYKALENGVANARRNLEKPSSSYTSSEGLLNLIPTYFPSATPILQQVQRSNEQVFLCAPVGSSQKKDFKPRWAVLFRDRLDIFNKYGDSKPWQSWPLTSSTLVQANRDSADALPYISLTNEKGSQLFLRAEHPSATNAPNTTIKSTIPAPDIEQMHHAWLFALKARASNLDYLAVCKQQGILHPDERLLVLFDSQHKSPASMHTNALYCPPNLYQQLPSLSSSQFTGAGTHPVSKLPFEGAIVDLAGGPFLPDALRVLATLLAEPDYLPVFGIKFEGASLDLKATETILMSLASNPTCNLVQLDLSNAKCLENANANDEDLLDLLAKFLTSSHLQRFERLFIKQSNLNSGFMTALILKINSMSRPIIAPLQVVDLSSNQLDDGSIPALIGLFNHSESIATNIKHFNLSWNTFSDISLSQLAHWFTLEKPSSTNYTLVQSPIAPFKPISLTGLYLQGCSSCSDAGFIQLSRSLLWHVRLTTLDLSNCLRLGDPGAAAVTKMAQINQSLEKVWFGSHRLNLEGLTALRLFYRFGAASLNPDLFGESYSQFTLVGLAAEANI